MRSLVGALLTLIALSATVGCGKTSESVGRGSSGPGGGSEDAGGGAVRRDGATRPVVHDAAMNDMNDTGAVADDIPAPSCMGLPAHCGASNAESCCRSPVVKGGTFIRHYDGGAFTNSSYTATLNDFRLDRFDVTVGRFRAFVSAYSQDMIAPGTGKNPHNPSDPGWDPTWNAKLPADRMALTAGVTCIFNTWMDTPGIWENHPINCVTWYEAFAFCIWDGGRLPSEAEWNYAAAGGSEQRAYPWSKPPSSTHVDCTYADYMGAKGGTDYCVNPLPGFGDTNDVGSESPKGDGRWGQADLAGNLIQWTLDWYRPSPPPLTCFDCADTTPAAGSRMIRGGSYRNAAATLLSSVTNDSADPTDRMGVLGFRCARSP